MDLVFAAEQYAQAQAAVAAAAQYYTNAAISAANGPIAPATPIMVTSAAAPIGLLPAQAVAAAAAGHPPGSAIISGTQVLGPQFLNAALATPTPLPQAPPPPPISVQAGSSINQPRVNMIGGNSDNDKRGVMRDSDNRERRRDNRDRHDRDHKYDRERGSDRDNYRSERYSRYDRDRDRDRRGDRDRNYDKRDRDDRRRRDRSPGRRNRSRSPYRRERERDCTPDSEDTDKDIPPNNTIMVRGLAQHIAESDIEDSIRSCGLQAKDIRLIRKKETGASRGFAFVEFTRVQDAQKWMEDKQGVLMFKDQYRAVMQYSLPRDAGKPGDNGSPRLIHHDWICAKCGVQNFRRRDYCFKCNGPKSDAEGEGFDEVSTHPTNTVFLRGLDALSTEDSVLNCLMHLTQLPIKSIRIGRDPLTQTSRGVCYVEMNSVVDAMFLHNQLLGEPPTIDDKLASVSYHKSSQQTEERNNTAHSSAASAAMAAAQWSHQGQKSNEDQLINLQAPYSEEDIERLAEYSASTYAKNEVEKAAYLDYYRTFYRNGGTLDGSSTSGSANVEQNNGVIKDNKSDLGSVNVDGVEYKRYRTPDVSKYVYDETSGYYYDATSTLYYDANSQYYFNSKTNQYMYWSSEHETFLPAPDNQENSAQDNDKKEDKKDKVKTAKRIAKDMEKWAKTLNQRKEAAKSNQVPANSQIQASGFTKINIGAGKGISADSNAGVEDVAFSMLNKRGPSNTACDSINLQSFGASNLSRDDEPPPPGSRTFPAKIGNAGLTGLASYNSDSEGESNDSGKFTREEEKHTDWDKLACLLCQRQFPSKEKLTKHNQLSELHKQNLEKWKVRSGSLEDANSDGQQYRDRARERRAKYGEADEPKPNKLKEKYMRAMQDVETKALPEKNIGSDNIGSKMLQRMGWKEGLGLGKSNQGRTDIVEAEQRTQKAGLGSGGPLRSNPNDSYKDCVKRTMYQRYHQLDG